MATGNDLLNLLTGKQQLPKINQDMVDILTGKKLLPVIKVEPTAETTALVKNTALILSGALVLLALSNISKRK